MKQKIRDFFLDEFAMERHAYCRCMFQMVFGVILTSLLIVPVRVMLHLTSPFATVGLMLLLLPPSVFLGYLAYERWIGPLLRKRGWNEKSFWRGMQLMVISVLFFETVIAVMLFALSLVLR